MTLKTKNEISTQFNMSSMTDMVFLLLIFFMLSVSFSIVPTSLPIDLPTSQTTQTSTPQVQISITAALDYYIGNQPVTLAELETVLKQQLPVRDGLVLLQVDRSVPVEHMIKALDIASSLNAQVSIATKPD